MYTRCVLYSLLSNACLSAIQSYLVILDFLIKWCLLQDFEAGTSTKIEEISEVAI